VDPMRQRWVIGNWKQQMLRDPARQLAREVTEQLPAALGSSSTHVGLAPPFLSLNTVNEVCAAQPARPRCFAQDVAAQDEGAFTGEVGPAMLLDVGVTGAIIGHSERRARFGDTEELVAAKLNSALGSGLLACLCVGETLEDRDSGDHENRVISQLLSACSDIAVEHLERLIIAYEPVWAIGTGRTASPDEADSMHAAIRSWLAREFGANGAGRSILYGGSVKPNNADELIARPEIDGFLVGGASLQAQPFLAIVRAAA
jgi:triosephosphate isomerase